MIEPGRISAVFTVLGTVFEAAMPVTFTVLMMTLIAVGGCGQMAKALNTGDDLHAPVAAAADQHRSLLIDQRPKEQHDLFAASCRLEANCAPTW